MEHNQTNQWMDCGCKRETLKQMLLQRTQYCWCHWIVAVVMVVVVIEINETRQQTSTNKNMMTKTCIVQE